MNKLLILLLLSTPLFAEDDLVDIEDKVFEDSLGLLSMSFSSNGEYTQEDNVEFKIHEGVWERPYPVVNSNVIFIYLRGGRCNYTIKKIADTYIFVYSEYHGVTPSRNCFNKQLLLKETEWSKANLPQKLDEYKNRTD